MFIVGLTGGIGHGKTTLGRYLGQNANSYAAYEASSLISEVANEWRASEPPKLNLSDLAGVNAWLRELLPVIDKKLHRQVSFDKLRITEQLMQDKPDMFDKLSDYFALIETHPDLRQQTINQTTKGRFRPLLQWLGGYLAKQISGDVWFSEIVRRIQVESQPELAVVGGVRFPADAACIQEAGGFIIAIVRPTAEETDLTDITERERATIRPDSTIINNGSLEQLKNTARQVFHDLKTGHLQNEYRAQPSA